MKRTATSIRCVPRFGYANTEVRTVDVDLPDDVDPAYLFERLEQWFTDRGVDQALFDITTDDNGLFAIVNDEAYEENWGTPLL